MEQKAQERTDRNAQSGDIINNSHEHKSDSVIYYSTGRGGAGNIKATNTVQSPNVLSQGSGTPKLHTPKVSTGRGGFGNMLKNSDPELTRKVQDVDGPKNVAKENDLYAVASNKSFSVGRGGFGNVVSKQTSPLSDSSNKSNLMAITSHSSRGNTKKKGILYKLKGFFSS